MSVDPLDQEVSERICLHMNEDHSGSLKKYAQYYGSIEKPQNAKMLSIDPYKMTLDVDNTIIEIPFDHTLINSEDAHKTLVKMLRSQPGEAN